MTERDFEIVKKEILIMLDGLHPQLTYHCKEHTVDVLEQSVRIAYAEKITDKHSLLLLKFAALFHDTGFLQTYFNHEEKGCEIFVQHTSGIEFTRHEKEIIQSLIMATKIPQAPKTHLQQIICDADLDYLGRDDFFDTAHLLKQEFLRYKIVSSETDWEKLQLNFLSHHHYHTQTSKELREPVKQQHYQTLLDVF